ncbi:MAG TPA: ankyrin repeat domain-containing protein, partial [Synergistales bacterium]|nr:ankyrin repeat domain-containing protein [Synergistales bacterium]
EVIRLLLEAGTFVNQVDSFGETALHAALEALARHNDAKDIVRMITEAGGETVFPVEGKRFDSNSERR